MKLVDGKTIEGIEATVVQKVDELKAVSENKTRVEKMRLLSEISDKLLEDGYYTAEEHAECNVGIGSILGFKFENFKK